jgi:glycosyltransferase involved in cell wall biosynthesis
VLFVIGTLDVGGAETQLVELVTRLNRQRYEPSVCCLAGEGPLAATLRAAGVRVHTIGFTGFRQHGAWLSLPRAFARLWHLFRIVRRERPDILHGVLFWAYVLSAFLGRIARVPVIVASRRSLGLFKAEKPHYLFVERIANRLTDLFIANSAAVRSDSLNRENLDPKRVLIVHNGVDVSRFSVAERISPAEPTRPSVLVVANLIEYKGHRYFLHAWADVLRRFPGAKAQLAGEGPMLQPLRDLAADLGIAHSVMFMGRRADIPELLAQCDLYAHPSLQEGYSNAVLEAMCAGAPIVATAVGGTVEAIADGETGLLVPPADAVALGRAMVRMLDDRAAAAAMGRRAAAVARRDYDIGRVVRRYEEIYEQLASGNLPEFEPAAEGMSRCAV